MDIDLGNEPEKAATELPTLGRAPWLAALGAAIAPCPVDSDPDILASFSRDQAPLAPAGTAAALVRARSTADVIATLRFAHERRIPVVTRAAGTGLAGGANATDGCILLSVLSLNRILSIDPATRTAVVEPGVLNGALAAAVAERGLFYAPDPASREISTIGGNIATNAGGACCLKYGVTGDHVAQLKVVLPDGTLLRTGGLSTKNVAGLDLTRLLVGSEGTLAVIVEATVRLLRAPRPASTLLGFFDTLTDAAAAIAAMDSSADLSLLEIMDRVTLTAVEELVHMELDTSAAALVIAQSDAVDAKEAIAHCAKLCQAHAARSVTSTDDAQEGRMLLAARRMALPALERLGSTLLDDVAVPQPALVEMIRRIGSVAEQSGLVIATFGHAGDGNLHPTIVFQPSQKDLALAAFDSIVQGAIELGGTISGEHGIGSLKQRHLGAMIGEAERALLARIKQAFDPHGILNPGKAI
ncbi:MAG TPA: FAD-linked oxidase C-terminal domain-containing protein [Polyangiaceae bacterium]|nr:FAD-linked oxidase C-terminal domain-containing protein [Polyangiaceae bacterium]